MLKSAALLATASSETQPITRVLRSDAEWHAIRSEWDELFAVSPTASTALDFAWLQTWWHVYEHGLRSPQLRVITVWRDTRLIGAIPLYVRQEVSGPLGLRCLGFLSTGEAEFEETCADYLNLLFVPGEDAVCVGAIWRAIELMSWDHLELLDLPASSPLLNRQCVPRSARLISRGVCPIADLSEGFDAYLEKLPPKRRQNARRLIREGERAGVTFEVVGSCDADGAFDDLVRLHQARWNADGKPGVFSAPRFHDFHRNLILQWLPHGRALLVRLSVGASPAAVLYGFLTGQKFDFYQSGVQRDCDGPLQSPGNLAHLLLMKCLAERGVSAYDFLRSSSAHKERQATRRNELIGMHIWRLSLRTVIGRTVRIVSRVYRKVTALVAGQR